MAIDVR